MHHPNSRAHSFFQHHPSQQQTALAYSSSAFMPNSMSSSRLGSGHSRYGAHTNRHEQHQHQHPHQQHHFDLDQCPGAEPGVNPRSGLSSAEYSHFKQECVIDVIDYDADDVSFQRLTNASFLELLGEEKKVLRKGDGELPPRMVRWINIGGIDWSVLRAVALKYNLHSLALEDILHERGHNHSKSDYYPGHLFIRVLCHTIHEEEPWHLGHSPSEDISPELSREEGLSEMPSGLNERDLEQGGYLPDNKVKPGNDHPPPNGTNSPPQPKAAGPPNAQAADVKGRDRKRDKFLPSGYGLRKRFSSLSGFKGKDRERQLMQILAMTKNERVFIKHEPMFIFLLRDGTVISIRPSPNLDYTTPISERLHRADSVLRTSEDASLLVESFLDLIVDRIVEMVDEYQVKITKLEHDILLHPDMDCVRSLHILSGDLIMHKRTLEPIKTMIFGLRRYDLDRCQALAETMAMDTNYASDTETESSTLNNDLGDDDDHSEEVKKAEGRDKKSKAKRKRRRERAQERLKKSRMESSSMAVGGGDTGSMSSRSDEEERLRQAPNAAKRRRTVRSPRKRKVEGYFSYQAKVYLADVYDHIDFALESLDMFSGISENLINYAFNMASYEMNNVMKRLTTVTIIFLPLTLLTGYFGMNFTSFWSVNNNSDGFFWELAVPLMLVLMPLFMFGEIKRGIKHWQRRWQVRQATKGIA